MTLDDGSKEFRILNLESRNQKSEIRNQKLEIGNWKLEIGNWKLEISFKPPGSHKKKAWLQKSLKPSLPVKCSLIDDAVSGEVEAVRSASAGHS